MKIVIFERTGQFAENKDIARDIRVNELMPALEQRKKVVIDFEHVITATQSFIHALLSTAIRKFGHDVFESIEFKSCNVSIRQIISVVANYMQDSIDTEH